VVFLKQACCATTQAKTSPQRISPPSTHCAYLEVVLKSGARKTIHLQPEIPPNPKALEPLLEGIDLLILDRWACSNIQPPLLKRAAELFAEAMTVREVADILRISRVNRDGYGFRHWTLVLQERLKTQSPLDTVHPT
jgi:hypothetical protein